MPLTENQLIEELCRAADRQSEPALTAGEIAEHTKLPRARVLRALKQLAEQGRIQNVTVYRRAVDGKARPCPGYIILPEARD